MRGPGRKSVPRCQQDQHERRTKPMPGRREQTGSGAASTSHRGPASAGQRRFIAPSVSPSRPASSAGLNARRCNCFAMARHMGLGTNVPRVHNAFTLTAPGERELNLGFSRRSSPPTGETDSGAHQKRQDDERTTRQTFDQLRATPARQTARRRRTVCRAAHAHCGGGHARPEPSRRHRLVDDRQRRRQLAKPAQRIAPRPTPGASARSEVGADHHRRRLRHSGRRSHSDPLRLGAARTSNDSGLFPRLGRHVVEGRRRHRQGVVVAVGLRLQRDRRIDLEEQPGPRRRSGLHRRLEWQPDRGGE